MVVAAIYQPSITSRIEDNMPVVVKSMADNMTLAAAASY